MSATSATILMAQYYHHVKQKREAQATNMSTPVDEFNYIDNTTLSSTMQPAHNELTDVDRLILVLHGIIFVLAVVGNSLVIATLAQNRRMRTVTNIFLLNLAISDLLLAIFCMPFTIIPVIIQDFIFGPVMCVLIRYLQGLSVSASAFTLVAISLERFYAICSPLKSRKWQHLRHSYKVLAAIWTTAMVINIPMAVFQKILPYPSGSRECSDEWPESHEKLQKGYYFLHLAVLDLLVPLTIMTIAYSLIAKTLWNSFKTVQVTDVADTSIAAKAKRQMSLISDASDISEESEMPLTAGVALTSSNGFGATSAQSTGEVTAHFNTSPHKHHNRQHSFGRQETVTSLRSHSSASNIKSKRRVIRMLFFIVIEFFICWTPLHLVYVWIILDRESAQQHIPSPKVFLSVLRLLAYTSSCCNPITYCFMSKKFRTAFLTAFRCTAKPKPLNRRPTIQSTQISYCDSNGQHHHHPQLQQQNSNKSKHALPITSSHSFYVTKHQLSPLTESVNSNGKSTISSC